MKLLCLAPYRQLDGWGQASMDYLKAIATTDIDLSCRPIYIGHTYTKDIPSNILECENKRQDEYDAVLQICLPNLLVYDGRFKKNIGMSFFETKNIQYTGWVEKINMMDEYWVATSQERQNLLRSGVTIPIEIIGPVTDINKYKNTYKNLFPNNKNFKFYYIGEYHTRKNIQAALIAFHREFNVNEPVDFIIKANIPGMNPEQTSKYIDSDINKLKSTMRLYNNIHLYKKEMLLCEFLTEEQINCLHSSCDCMIMSSYGESICRPVLDAVGFGNTPIVTEGTGMTEYVNSENGYTIPSIEVPVISTNHPGIPNVYSSFENWQQVNIIELQKRMRFAFEDRIDNPKRKMGRDSLSEYSYTKIGEKIKNVLTS